ncbi:MAG: hypothetical protein K0S22_1695 [Oscillospiraceae bacterium]|jgi:hypothetical protein|nr:hypothetical protein [Oscillospiraceae bacterium]
MKQLSIIALIVIIAILFTACSKRNLGVSSSSTSSAPQNSQNQSAVESLPTESNSASSQPVNAAEKYVDILKSGTYYIDCNAVIQMEGMQLENTMLIAAKDGNSSISVSSDLSGTLVTIRTLVYEGNVYQINDAQRSYMQIDTAQSGNRFDIDFTNLRYVGESTGSFLGKTLPCSEYARGEQTVRLFFDGNTLLGMTQSITDEQANEIVLKINGLSANIPDQLVAMPIGYTKE